MKFKVKQSKKIQKLLVSKNDNDKKVPISVENVKTATYKENLEKIENNKLEIFMAFDYFLPYGYLPNAIESNTLILELIRSQSPTKLDDIFLYDGEEWNKFFGTKDVHYPPNNVSTLLHTWSVTRKFVEIDVHIPAIQREKQRPYVYPIAVQPDKQWLIGSDSLEVKKYSGRIFWQNMSAIALDDMLKSKLLVWLEYYLENFVSKDFCMKFSQVLHDRNIPPKNIILIVNSINHKEIFDKWYKNSKFEPFHIHSIPFFFLEYSYYLKNRDDYKEKDSKLIMNKLINEKRKYHFTLKVNRDRPHRKAFIYNLYNKNLLKLADWSLLEAEIPETAKYQVKEFFNLDIPLSKIQEVVNLVPKNLDGEEGKRFTPYDFLLDENLEQYYRSYFYICTESFFIFKDDTDSDQISIPMGLQTNSEKICKPIANYLPFIYFATPGALKGLRDLGFRTFHPYIDESYDIEDDYKKRFNMIMLEIEKLCAMSKDEIHNWYVKLMPILVHNREWLKNFDSNTKYLTEFLTFIEKAMKNEL